MSDLPAPILAEIDELVKKYEANKRLFSMALNGLKGTITEWPELTPHIHSFKSRIKDPEHLRAKLIRIAKNHEAKSEPFPITPDNLFTKINDLAGFRIIHLHSTQIQPIDIELKKIFAVQEWPIVEGPEAKTWDDEYRRYFSSIGIVTTDSHDMYTSVHYVVQPNSSTKITCEVQVRTLMEEVWSEVSHTVNYPEKSMSLSCQEQIKVLARLTSGCSRLVDSIFQSNEAELKKLKESAKS